MSRKSVLVTGGAGYIGGHVVYSLLEAGYAITVLDNLSTGRRELCLERLNSLRETQATRGSLQTFLEITKSQRFSILLAPLSHRSPYGTP